MCECTAASKDVDNFFGLRGGGGALKLTDIHATIIQDDFVAI